MPHSSGILTVEGRCSVPHCPGKADGYCRVPHSSGILKADDGCNVSQSSRVLKIEDVVAATWRPMIVAMWGIPLGCSRWRTC
jgi:hypothetical protein